MLSGGTKGVGLLIKQQKDFVCVDEVLFVCLWKGRGRGIDRGARRRDLGSGGFMRLCVFFGFIFLYQNTSTTRLHAGLFF